MSKVVIRKIVVNKEEFYWTLQGNTIDGAKENHIKIHRNKVTKSILYIDPYDWSFELRPKTIKAGILFALTKGWDPDKAHTGFIISMKKDVFYVLPEGIHFGYQIEKNGSIQ